jgi:hypothetical protein
VSPDTSGLPPHSKKSVERSDETSKHSLAIRRVRRGVNWRANTPVKTSNTTRCRYPTSSARIGRKVFDLSAFI